MSELCLLAVNLLTQGDRIDRQVASVVPPSAAVASETKPSPSCETANLKGNVPAEAHPPEFSRVSSPIRPGQSGRAMSPSAPIRPVVPKVAPVAATAQPEAASPSARSNPRPAIAIQTPGVTWPSFNAPTPATPEWTSPRLTTPRPSSGSQLYEQRLAALRAGRTYTRLPVDSFYDHWINAIQQPTYEQWISLLAHEAQAVARGQGSNRLTVLVGDSLLLWYPPEQLSRDRLWLNQGISGDTTTGVLRRLSSFAQTRPDTIHVMAGINDLRRGSTDQEILTNVRQIMRQLRQEHPQSQIYVHSILPTRLAAIPVDRIHRLNQSIAAIATQEAVAYLDLQPEFADTDGTLRRDLTTDGLHLNPDGYAVLQAAIR